MMEKNADSNAQLPSHNTSIHNLEVQLGQISQTLNTLPKRALPSDEVVNPKGGNNTGHAMTVTTRIGKGGDATTSRQRKIVDDEQVVHEDEIPNNEETREEVNLSREHIDDILKPVVPKAKALMPSPPPPYHQSLAKQNGEIQFKKFVDMMKSLSINVPLVEALEQIPGYAKFIKDLMTKKRSMKCETIKMTHQTLGIGQPRPTSMRLQMGDRTMKRPLGIIDDVLVRVDKFILPTDFVILDCEVDYEVPIILGRPFLATGKSLVDVEAEELTFRISDEKVVFHVCKSMRQPNSNEVCSFVDLVINVIIDQTSAMMNVDDTLEAVLLNCDDKEMECYVECVNSLQGMESYTYVRRKLSLDLENRTTSPTKSSIEEPPVLELKPFPPHLRYEFLGPSSTLPVIISSYLTNVQVDSTLAVL
ncbi:uncharacterized protein [Nicotiana sylvestris]|uniref:uncharacterized protein n=1 Tax=Nicotiana sylvestris TaxID=4096 RepID=UPI00388C3935